jgi:hypothetical protein
MTWLWDHLKPLIAVIGFGLTFYIADKVFKEKHDWEMQAVVTKNEEQDERLKTLEKEIMEKLTIMQGDIRKIEGKLER